VARPLSGSGPSESGRRGPALRRFLRSYPGWFAFQVAEYAVLFALAKLLLAIGLAGWPTYVVVVVLAVALVLANYNLRRRYLSDDEA
jgi:hypothetical protein